MDVTRQRLADVLYNAVRICTQDFKNYTATNAFLTIFEQEDKTYLEYISDNLSFLYVLPFAINTSKVFRISMRDLVNEKHHFYKHLVKVITLDIFSDKISIRLYNAKYNKISLDVYGEDRYQEKIDILSRYVDDDKRFVFTADLQAFVSMALNDYVNNMIRTDFNLSTAYALDNGPAILLNKYTKEMMNDMIESLEATLEDQKKIKEEMQKDNMDFAVDFAKLFEFNLGAAKLIMQEHFKNEDDTYVLGTLMTISTKPSFQDQKRNEVLYDIIKRLYYAYDVNDEMVILYPHDLYYIANFALSGFLDSGKLNIYYDDNTKSKRFMFELFDNAKIYGILPDEQHMKIDRSNMFLLGGMRAVPEVFDLTEEKMQEMYDALFGKKDEDLENYEEYIVPHLKRLVDAYKLGKGDLEFFDNFYKMIEESTGIMRQKYSFIDIFKEIIMENEKAQSLQ
ncbi:MAG: hypothetical protein QXF12_02140 [Candidatus Aenigmatarchaeota archaeon]